MTGPFRGIENYYALKSHCWFVGWVHRSPFVQGPCQKAAAASFQNLAGHMPPAWFQSLKSLTPGGGRTIRKGSSRIRPSRFAPSFEIVHQSLCPQTGQGRDLLALCQEGFMGKWVNG